MQENFALRVFLLRFDCIIEMLQRVGDGGSFAENQRATAKELHTVFQTKQFVAFAYLFQEIFDITGPLSRYLQSVNVDFGKAIDLIDSSISRIQIMRDNPEKIIEISDSSVVGVEWSSSSTNNGRRKSNDEPTGSPEAQWKHDTFYTVQEHHSIVNEEIICFIRTNSFF